MEKRIDVYLTEGNYKDAGFKFTGQRSIVNVEVVEERPHTFLVRLSDGSVIVRKKKNQIVVKG